MKYVPYVVSNFRQGLVDAVDPWILPAEAFQNLVNAEVYQGAIRRRNGYELLERFPNYKTAITGITQADPGVITVSSAAGLANDQPIQITDVAGMTQINGGSYTITGLSGSTFSVKDASGTTVDTSGFGAYTSGGVVGVYNDNAITGLLQWQDANGNRLLVGFDTKQCAWFNTSLRIFIPTETGDTFSGDEWNYFQGDGYPTLGSGAYTGYFYVTNGVDNIFTFTFDGTNATTNTITPQIDANPYNITTCKFIHAIRNRLLLFYTTETGTSGTATYPQRMSWSAWNGAGDFTGANAWDRSTPGRGGFADAPTTARIVATARIFDSVLVAFEKGLWVVHPTTNPAAPFKWQQINNTRTVDGAYSFVGYDQQALGIGQPGIIAASPNQVQIGAPQIPNFGDRVYRAEWRRMYGAHYEGKQQTWWSFTSVEGELSENDKVLVRNEKDNLYFEYEAAFSCFGTLEDVFDETWTTLGSKSWEDLGDDTNWTTFAEYRGPQFVSGDTSGNVYLMDRGYDDNGSSYSLQLETGELNPFREQGGLARLGWVDILVDVDFKTQFQVDLYVNGEPDDYSSSILNAFPEDYAIGQVQNVTLTNPAGIQLANHALSTGDNVYIYGVQGALSAGEQINAIEHTVTVVDEDNFTLDGVDLSAATAYEGGGVVLKHGINSLKVWKRAYAGGTGESHRLLITSLTDSALEIHAIAFYFSQVGARVNR